MTVLLSFETFHQGATLDKVCVELDGCFAAGQVCVCVCVYLLFVRERESTREREHERERERARARGCLSVCSCDRVQVSGCSACQLWQLWQLWLRMFDVCGMCNVHRALLQKRNWLCNICEIHINL